MNKVLATAVGAAVLLVCFGLAFQAGKSEGFRTGSEWAIMQADIVAREAGLNMPVYLDENNFRIVIRQQPGIYRRAWKRADMHEETKNVLQNARAHSFSATATDAAADSVVPAGDTTRRSGVHAEVEPAKEGTT